LWKKRFTAVRGPAAKEIARVWKNHASLDRSKNRSPPQIGFMRSSTLPSCPFATKKIDFRKKLEKPLQRRFDPGIFR